MKTVKQKLEYILYKHGLFEQQARKIVDLAIPKINELSDDYQIEWDSDEDVYQEDMYNFLFSLIKPEALKWIDENVPKAWYRENFID